MPRKRDSNLRYRRRCGGFSGIALATQPPLGGRRPCLGASLRIAAPIRISSRHRERVPPLTHPVVHFGDQTEEPRSRHPLSEIQVGSHYLQAKNRVLGNHIPEYSRADPASLAPARNHTDPEQYYPVNAFRASRARGFAASASPRRTSAKACSAARAAASISGWCWASLPLSSPFIHVRALSHATTAAGSPG